MFRAIKLYPRALKYIHQPPEWNQLHHTPELRHFLPRATRSTVFYSTAQSKGSRISFILKTRFWFSITESTYNVHPEWSNHVAHQLGLNCPKCFGDVINTAARVCGHKGCTADDCGSIAFSPPPWGPHLPVPVSSFFTSALNAPAAAAEEFGNLTLLVQLRWPSVGGDFPFVVSPREKQQKIWLPLQP